MKKNMMERVRMVKAMEYIVRQVNDERVRNRWRMNGVAYGIEYGDFAPVDDNMDCYCEDNDNFAELMDCFLRVMRLASYTGGLYCNGVFSK